METKEPMRIVHVDDDPGSIRKLRTLLSKQPDIDYLGGFTTATEALTFLRKENTDLLILDVEMPEHNGLWLAEQLRPQQTDIAFVTAHAGYATQAFDACALDYMLKPVDADKLEILLQRVRYNRGQRQPLPSVQTEQIESFYRYLDPQQRPNRIFISMMGKTLVVELKDVVYFRSVSNYTQVVMSDAEIHTTSKTIKTYEDALKHNPDFLRVQRSYIVNKSCVTMIRRDAVTRRISITMNNGDVLDTSFKTKEDIIEALAF